MADKPVALDRNVLIQFLDWYDPEASHRDIGLAGVVDSFLAEKTSGRSGERLDDKTFLEYTDKVAKSLAHNAAHSFAVPIYELNLLLIECDKRLKEAEDGR
ncbi:hypothetical protein HWC80_gp085 [Mycobacterium phage Indlulamithi]|uniref:Uncharacterized protein n=1 Tax=Mycobacterium phage Indlulamithi TaxID=2656582 RepID=A0A649VCS6_9CAUD|nr:hypothetical protein HWC80_gp085 [Mycobacterium phage Indlulamithi]QGJ90127.1 hypothetical protein PBI_INDLULAMITHI_89 [Mycobacterium phage Indlulamithi]